MCVYVVLSCRKPQANTTQLATSLVLISVHCACTNFMGHSKWHYLLHVFLCLLTLSGWIGHVYAGQSLYAKNFALASTVLWSGLHIYRFSKLRLNYTSTVVHNLWTDRNVIFVRLDLKYKIRIFPGCYFYVFPNRCSSLHGYPIMFFANDNNQPAP